MLISMVSFVYPISETDGVVVEKDPVDVLRIFKLSGEVVTDYVLRKSESNESVSWAEIKEILKQRFSDFGDYLIAVDFAFNLVKDWRSALW